MKDQISRKDPDFEDHAVTFNGDLLRHDTIVSACASLGRVRRLATDSNGAILKGNEIEVEGIVRIIERNDAVRAKEPPSERVVQEGLAPEKPAKAEASEDAPPAAPAAPKPTLRVKG